MRTVVRGDRGGKLWNEYVARYHYLGYKTLVGAQMRYAVHASDGTPLAMLGFSTAAWTLAPRDRFIGWSRRLREKNLPLVVDNPRFLILPWIHIPNLGSHILALVRRQLPADWTARYKTTPVLIETFVQTPRYTGAVYRASGWIRVGATQGRGRYDMNNRSDKPKKDIWLRPLRKDWKKRSWKEDRRIIYNELFPAWRAMRATEIRRRDIRTLIEKIAERPAPSMANRIQLLIHKMFNFAIAHEIVEFNPCAQLELPARERARDRVLSDAEIRRFWSVLDGEPADIAAGFRLRLITAQRGGEVHGMRWEHVDLAGRWWTIPGSVAKNGLAHRVPLSDLALEVVFAVRARQTPKTAASGYVLSSAARDPRRRRPTIRRLGLNDFRGHDLRRTAASRMASAGCPRLVIGKVLNHAEPGVTAVYDRHTYDTEKRQALQTWARSLRALLDADTAGGDQGFVTDDSRQTPAAFPHGPSS